MKTILNYLKRLDFSEVETRLYILLLKSGSLTVAELAQVAKINRSATYAYINSLLEKGVIAKVKGNSSKVVANPPEYLQYLVEQKITSAMSLKETLPNVINILNTSFPQAKKASNSEVKYFKGIVNARKIYEEALRADELRSYIRIDRSEPLFPNNPAVFADAFKINKKLKIWEIIYNKDMSAPPSESSRSHIGRYFYKYMPKSQKLSSEDILIYDGKVAIINYKGGKTSIVLHSTDLYNNFKDIFTFLWDMLPKPDEK